MPNRPFPLEAFYVVYSRSHYSIMGSNYGGTDHALHGEYHGLLRSRPARHGATADSWGINPGDPTDATISVNTPAKALQAMAHRIIAGAVVPHDTLLSGHHAGPDGICHTAGCDRRYVHFFPVIRPGGGHGFAAHLMPRDSAPTTGEAFRFLLNCHNPAMILEMASALDGTNLPPNPPPVEDALPVLGAPIVGHEPAGAISPTIQSIGVELECLVPSGRLSMIDRWVEACPRAEVQRDGSIIPDEENSVGREYTFWTTDLLELRTWLGRMYDAGVTTNPTCGFHVHVRPEPHRLWVMGTRHYWDGMMGAYHDMYGGNRKYARRITSEFAPFLPWCRTRVTDQLSVNRAEYSAINLSSLRKHGIGAVEHRMLPYQETAEEAVHSLRWLVTTTDDLVKTAPVPVESHEREALLSPDWTLLFRPNIHSEPYRPESLVNDDTTTARHLRPIGLPWDGDLADIERGTRGLR